MLRAIRFSTQLGFEIESKTWDAVCSGASNITGISGERIAMELESIFTNPARLSGLQMLIDSGLIFEIFPNYSKQYIEPVLKVLSNLPDTIDWALALAVLFIKCDPDNAIKQLDILKLSNADQKHIHFLLENIDALLNADMSLACLKQFLASPYYADLFTFQQSIQKAGDKPVDSLLKIRSRAEDMQGVDLTPKPLLNGHELIQLGVSPAQRLGLLASKCILLS